MDEIQSFEPFDGQIRKVWDEKDQEWRFAIVDVIELLVETERAAEYWRKMRKRDLAEIPPFWWDYKMKHKKNNRTYKTDCANEEGLLRIIQSISSPKAEPFKLWLAQTGARRLEEIRDNPIELEREKYRLSGYDEDWINSRLNSKAVRNELTDEWKNRQITGRQYGQLTDEIHQGTFDGMNVKRHKEHKGVEKGNLRDHMTPLELAFTILGEATTLEIARNENAQGFGQNLDAAKRGGEGAGSARKLIEESIGKSVISDKSYIEERKRLLAHGSVGKCDSCHNPVQESETYGTEVGSLCSNCFDNAVAAGEINQDGEIL
ncbi:MAG: Bro-N domain-containing protein [Chloroflexota bacterium]